MNLQFIEAEIQDQYTISDNNRPWVVGFSGGKDSTMLLNLVWRAVAKLPVSQRHRPIYVVCNDTQVENPHIVQQIEQTLCKIEAAAPHAEMPIVVVRTMPAAEQGFWFNLIGKGYPAPSSTFRWCTDRLKIAPTTRFIQSKISQAGEVIILLGTREAESAKRKQSMQKHEVKGSRLRKHSLPGASVYAPIRHVTTEEVWQYLLAQQSQVPWGGSHRDLITLYRNASTDAECPLVVDTTTPSCGKSRFGCYTCTVVNQDKSMAGLIENGQEWMQPVADLRDFLIETRDNPETYRSKTLRRGYELEGRWGPLLPSTRAEVLRRLLVAQHEMREHDPGITLINSAEMVTIQHQWYLDGIYTPTVAQVQEQAGDTTRLTLSQKSDKQAYDQKLLQEVCDNNPAHVALINAAVGVLQNRRLQRTKRGVQGDIEALLDGFLATQQTSSTTPASTAQSAR
jgi:DNA sulfur modification protein DndC